MNDIDEMRPIVVKLLRAMQRIPEDQINLDMYWRESWLRKQPCGCVGGWAEELLNEDEFQVFCSLSCNVDVYLFAGYGNGVERELMHADVVDVTHKIAALYRLLRLVFDEQIAKQEIVEYATYGRDLAKAAKRSTKPQLPAKVGVADLPPILTLNRVIP